MGDVYDWELEQKTANTISVGAIPEWMLKGYRTKPQGQGEPRRHLIHDPNLVSRGDYHKNGEVAFADVFEQPDRVNIGYVSTAPELRGQGHASRLMQHVYDSYPDKRIVWGQRMDDAAEHMYQKYRQTMPDRTARTAAPDLATNWVYFRHKNWDEPRLVSGAQPHHVLIHKVHDGELDGEDVMGNLSNTWAATNGTPKGLEHDVARGVYDKKGRPQIWESNCDRNLVYDKALEKYEYAIPRPGDAQHEARGYTKSAEEMYAEIQGKGWNVESQGPKGDRFSVTITNPQGSRVERQGNTQEQALASALTWVWQHSHMSMAVDLPITPRTTLGQVFSKLRPNQADGNHLGMQAHALNYTSEELATFLEAQEADGTPRGWRVFKDAAVTAYASRGWKVESTLKLVLWNALTGEKKGPTVNSLQEGIQLAEQQMQQKGPDGQPIIYRAQVIDPMFPNSPKWDTDTTTLKGEEQKDNPYGWEVGKEIPIQRAQPVPVDQDWAFSTTGSEETKPDFTFVYYQGVLEVEEKTPNSRPMDMLKRILDLGGKDITDQNVDDNNMASGDITKRDGEIDVQLTNLADEDVQAKALDSVHEWAQGMNLIGPIQPHNG